jgi:hypothetical protein
MQQPNEPAPTGAPGAPAPQRRPDWPLLIAIAGLVLGWFVLDAVAIRVGHFITSARFYELAALIAHPARLVTGVKDDDLPLTLPFGALCIAAIAAVLWARRSTAPHARVGFFAPLALMVACAAILYDQAAKDTFVAGPDAGEVGQALANLGNAIVRRTGAVLTEHIAVGAGAWVAAIAAAYLAYAGVRGPRRPGH